MATKCDKCEVTKDVRTYTYPVEVDGKILTAKLCNEHAISEGFCPSCGYFVAGSDYDHTISSHGICSDCLEELKIELGEYDEPEDYDYEGPY